jgi:hypothetical protein
MPAQLALAVPYDLGFEVRYAPPPLWSRGDDVFIGLEAKSSPGPDATREYDSLVTLFFMLATTGALSGAAIDPAKGRIRDRDAAVESAREVLFVLRGCRVDEAATILCANALSLAHQRFPIRRLRIGADPTLGSASAALAYQSQNIDPYPAIFSALPFPCDFDPDQDAPSVTIELAQPPDPRAQASIRDELLTWAAAAASGIYATVSALPVECTLAFDPADLRFAGNEVSLDVFSFRSHEAALRGLVNACAAIHASVAPIAAMAIA